MISVIAAPDTLLEAPDTDAREQPEARVTMRESIGLAFVTALQLLPPRQRAVLLLVDVLGWKPQEAAELLESTVVSVNSLLQRARRAVDTRRSDDTSEEAVEDEDLLRRYIATWESGDLDAFVGLLAEDAILSMPPQPQWYAGRDAIRRFIARTMARDPRRYRLLPIRANGAPALAFYMATPEGVYEAAAIAVLSFREGRVAQITRFAAPHLFASFGLADRLPQT